MATETGKETYCPLILGTWRYLEEVGTAGGWGFELEHELLLVGYHDAATAIRLPAGTVIMYESMETKPNVITGMFWSPTPPAHIVDEVAIAGEILDRLNREQEQLKDALLQVLPF